MKKFYRVSEAAALLNVSPSTLRKYTSEGRIEDIRNPAGQRVYTAESIAKFRGGVTSSTVFYIRASDGSQSLLDTQLELLNSRYGTPDKVFRDKASGLNENRTGLRQLLKYVRHTPGTRVCVTEKDRLTRFGFSYLQELFEVYGGSVEVLGEQEDKSLHEELIQDFLSLLASFSGKYYRIRGHEQKMRMLKEAEERVEKDR